MRETLKSSCLFFNLGSNEKCTGTDQGTMFFLSKFSSIQAFIKTLLVIDKTFKLLPIFPQPFNSTETMFSSSTIFNHGNSWNHVFTKTLIVIEDTYLDGLCFYTSIRLPALPTLFSVIGIQFKPCFLPTLFSIIKAQFKPRLYTNLNCNGRNPLSCCLFFNQHSSSCSSNRFFDHRNTTQTASL